MASICCSPPESVPALPDALPEARKSIEDALEIARAVRLAPPVGAELEVFQHAHVGEYLRPSGTWIRPSSTMAGGAQAVDPLAAEMDLAAPGRG